MGNNQQIIINDQQVTNTDVLNNWATDAACVTFTPTFASSIGDRLYKIEQPTWQTGAGIAGVIIDGEVLVDGTGESVSVVSVDAANSQMVVDGGDWAEG